VVPHAISPDGKFLIAGPVTLLRWANYSIGNDGSLVELYREDSNGIGSPIAAAVSEDSRYVYRVMNYGKVQALSLDNKTGTMSPIAGSEYAAGGHPIAIAITH
jgi:hypothetical protein